MKRWLRGIRYQGRHQGVYEPKRSWSTPVPAEMVYLGEVLGNCTVWGVVSDLTGEPSQVTATLTLVPNDPALTLDTLLDRQIEDHHV